LFPEAAVRHRDRHHNVEQVASFLCRTAANQVSRVTRAPDLSSGMLDKIITSGLFQTPTTAALFGDTLAVVNAKFDTGVPPTATQFEVVLTGA